MRPGNTSCAPAHQRHLLRRSIWTAPVLSDAPTSGSENRGRRVAKPLAPEGSQPNCVSSAPVKQGVLRGKPVLWSWPAFWAGSNRRAPPMCVFAYFLHKQKVGPRRELLYIIKKKCLYQDVFSGIINYFTSLHFSHL